MAKTPIAGMTVALLDSPLWAQRFTSTRKASLMSHDETLRNVFGVTLETVVRRILRAFDSANVSTVEAGARWYDDAGALAATLAQHTDGDIERAASVISALSPRTTWARNVAGATALLTSGPAAARRVGCIGRNVEKARQARVDGFAAFNMATAPKTASFARNIAGDRESVTVDVWAMRVVDLDELKLSRKGAYDAVAHAYRLAARRRGVDPATMQATTWIVARNGRSVVRAAMRSVAAEEYAR